MVNRRLRSQPLSVVVGVPSPFVAGDLGLAVARFEDVLGSDLLAGHVVPLVVGLRRLAQMLDEDPRNDRLWREFRGVLKDIREVVGDGGPSDLDVLIDGLRASVGDDQNPQS